MSFIFLPEATAEHPYTLQLQELETAVQHSFTLIKQLEQRVQELTHTHDLISKALAKSRSQKGNVSNISYDDMLISALFPHCSYDYALGLLEPLQQPLYKDRNFGLAVGLFDLQGSHLTNKTNLQLKFLLYTAAEQPQLIRETMQGDPILKGRSQAQLVQGEARWRKLSVREVSSKFEKGVVHVVVVAVAPGLDIANIDFERVRPLAIRNVAVKAKKI